MYISIMRFIGKLILQCGLKRAVAPEPAFCILLGLSNLGTSKSSSKNLPIRLRFTRVTCKVIWQENHSSMLRQVSDSISLRSPFFLVKQGFL